MCNTCRTFTDASKALKNYHLKGFNEAKIIQCEQCKKYKIQIKG